MFAKALTEPTVMPVTAKTAAIPNIICFFVIIKNFIAASPFMQWGGEMPLPKTFSIKKYDRQLVYYSNYCIKSDLLLSDLILYPL